MEGNNKEADIRAWNVAYSTAVTNVACIDETLACSKKNIQIKETQVENLANTTTLTDIELTGKSDPSAWQELLEKTKKHYENTSSQRIEQTKEYYDNAIKKLQENINKLDDELEKAKKTHAEYKEMLDKKLPDYKPVTYEEVEANRRRLESLQQTLRKTEFEKNPNEFFTDK